jgi:hypothetical protein
MSRAAGSSILAVVGLLALSGLGLSEKQPGSPVTFTDIAAQAGLTVPSIYGGVEKKRFIIETNGAGVAWVDVDHDGWLDALVLGGTRLREGSRAEDPAIAAAGPTTRLYRNTGHGTFTDVTARSGLGLTTFASSVCAGDYDNDGAVDLFITSFGRNYLFHNLGDGRFTDVTAQAGLPTTGPARWGSGCSFVDYDRDGKLDLFVSNYLKFDLATASEPGQGVNCLWKGIPVNCGPKGLPTDTNLLYHNAGNGTFVDVSDSSGISKVTGRYSMTALAADFDDDGWVDIYVASDSTSAILYHNNHDGTFTDVALPSGAGLSENGMPQAGMGVGVGDFNADGRLDLFKTHFADDIPALYRATSKGQFEDIATAAGLAVENRFVEWGAAIADFDNDGWQDLMYMTGNVYPEVEQRFPRYPHKGPRVLFLNRGDGRFEQATRQSGPGITTPRSSRGAAFGDFDNDGDVDVLVMNMNEPPSLLRNDYHGPNHWLTVQLQGTTSNRLGLGATVRVTSGGRTQARAILSQSSYYSHDDLRAHFGLGSSAFADRIDVAWPNGGHDLVEHVAADRFVVIREGAGLGTAESASRSRNLTVENIGGAPARPFAANVTAWVFVFTRTDCPVAARYSPELLRLQQRARAAHMAFDLVFVDPSESPATLRSYLRDYGFGDTAFRDPEHRLVQLSGATTTPEAAVFVPSASGPTLVYKGRIDDRYVDISHMRPMATRHDLDDVLTAIGQGRRPEPRATPAAGCLIADVTR